MYVFVNAQIFVGCNVFLNYSLEMVTGFPDELHLAQLNIYTWRDLRYLGVRSFTLFHCDI